MKYGIKLLFVVALCASLMGAFDVLPFLRHKGTEPKLVTLEELGNGRVSQNERVIVTKFLVDPHILCEQRPDGSWSRVWIPLLAADGKSTSRPIVAWSSAVPNPAKLKMLLNTAALIGQVTNNIDSLSQNERDKFATTYPHSDLDQAIVVRIDR